MDNQDTYEKIEAYLRGELSGAERSQFEENMKSDPAMAQQVELFKNLDIALADEGALALQKQTQKLGDAFFTETGNKAVSIRKLPFYRRPLAIAASIAILLSLGVLLWMNNNSSSMSSDELYAAYYEPPDFADGVRGEEGAANDYQKALDALREEDPATAINLLQAHIARQPADISAAFALGTAHLKTEPPALGAAKAAFQRVADDGKSLLVDQSNWYLALIALKQGNSESAQQLLQELRSSEEPELARKAEELLEKL